MKNPVTPRMQDVADFVGLHRTAVSLALRGHPSIPETTRARVRAAAEQLGYRPHPFVSALMSYKRALRTGPRHVTLAYVTSSTPPGAWKRDRTIPAQFAGAKKRARLLGYQLEEFSLFANGMTPARADQVLRSRGIVGLVIAPLRHGGDTLPLSWEHFAAVGVAFTLQRPFIPRVGNDHGQSARRAVQECRRRGCRRIGLALQRNIVERVEEQWLAGYLTEHAFPERRAHPPPLIAERLDATTFTPWLRAERPDAVITGGESDSVLEWVRRSGRRVPEEVAVVALDLHVSDGSIAGIDQCSEEIGATVVDTLVGRLYRNERGALSRPLRIHVMGEWIEGATLRNVSG